MSICNINVMNDASEHLNYNNPSIPLYAMPGNLSSFPHMQALCHWHDDIEFLIALKGHITYHVNDKDILLSEGNAILVNSRQMHYGYSADCTDCDYICVVFKPSLISTNKDVINRYIAPITDHSGVMEFLFSSNVLEHRQIIADLKEIYEVYHQKTEGYELLAVSLLCSLWFDIYHILRDQIIDIDDSVPADFLSQKQMVQFIYDHYSEKLSLDEIAHSGGISRTKCYQLFKKYLNRTPLDFLNSYRLENSMNLLHDTELSITEIAYHCGFNTLSYYSEIFKKYKGCTPKEFRSLIS